MSDKKYTQKAVPSSRLSRFASIGGMAASLSGNIIKNTMSAAFKAQKPNTQNTLLNINNAHTITKHLANMRGAAMKIGQMLSMDAGELLPAEWEPILALLREEANSMPKAQLLAVLQQNWGDDWQDKFAYFSFEPIAAASIGQVHRARLKSGEDLAVKVQYPGVAQSIDSDIDNVAGLLKLTRLVPKGLDIENILEQAKTQLKQEADYYTELGFLQQYHRHFADDPRFIIPRAHEALCSRHILCMEFIDARPMAELAYEPIALKNEIVSNLFDLVFSELFRFRFTQSDPNFANFLYQPESKKLVLLDFGACITLSENTSVGYLKMARAMQSQNREDMLKALLELGLLNPQTPDSAIQIVIDACDTASEVLQTDCYNFKQTQIIQRLQKQSQGLITEKDAIASPEFDVALVNRKVSGTVMLANKMNVDIKLRDLLAPYIEGLTENKEPI